jgi:hypothetical protein
MGRPLCLLASLILQRLQQFLYFLGAVVLRTMMMAEDLLGT